MLTKNYPFSGTLLSHNPLSGQKWYKQLWTKSHLSKTIPIPRSDAPIWKVLYGTCRCPEQMSHKKKNNKKKQKKKWIVMPCTWKIRLSLNENQECKKKCKKNDEKSHKHKSFFSRKESLFSLGNYVWDEKWPSFIILSLIKKNYP